jgi:hypothetical protein
MVVALIALFVALGGTGYAARDAILSSPSKAQIIKIVKGLAPSLKVAGLAPLPSGKTESGIFAAGGTYSTAGWIGLTITYPRPLTAAIPDDHVIVVYGAGVTAAHCSGPGHAAAGYLCVYNSDESGLNTPAEVYSDDNSDFPPAMARFGVNLYWTTNSVNAYAGGSWAVTAP